MFHTIPAPIAPPHVLLDQPPLPAMTLTDLPREVVEMISDRLPAKDLGAFALTCRSNAQAAGNALKREKISHEIARISGKSHRRWGERLETFQRLTTAIQGLRKSDQSRPLQQLIECLDRLPEAECRQAAALLLTFKPMLPASFLGRLEILAEHGSPLSAIAAGVSVITVVDHFYASCVGWERREVESRLRSAAIQVGPAPAALMSGEAPDQVAKRFDLGNFTRTMQWRIERIGEQMQGVLRTAELSVLRGENVTAVAQHHGITDQNIIQDLELCAAQGVAGEAAALGEPVDGVATTHGIQSRTGRLFLENAACCGVASEAVRNGERVDATADRHGIESLQSRFNLLLHAMGGRAGDEVRSGTAVKIVAHRHGVDLSKFAAELQRHSPGSEGVAGTGQGDAVSRAQKTTLDNLEWLEEAVTCHAESRSTRFLPFLQRFTPLLLAVPRRHESCATEPETQAKT